MEDTEQKKEYIILKQLYSIIITNAPQLACSKVRDGVRALACRHIKIKLFIIATLTFIIGTYLMYEFQFNVSVVTYSVIECLVVYILNRIYARKEFLVVRNVDIIETFEELKNRME